MGSSIGQIAILRCNLPFLGCKGGVCFCRLCFYNIGALEMDLRWFLRHLEVIWKGGDAPSRMASTQAGELKGAELDLPCGGRKGCVLQRDAKK